MCDTSLAGLGSAGLRPLLAVKFGIRYGMSAGASKLCLGGLSCALLIVDSCFFSFVSSL